MRGQREAESCLHSICPDAKVAPKLDAVAAPLLGGDRRVAQALGGFSVDYMRVGAGG